MLQASVRIECGAEDERVLENILLGQSASILKDELFWMKESDPAEATNRNSLPRPGHAAVMFKDSPGQTNDVWLSGFPCEVIEMTVVGSTCGIRCMANPVVGPESKQPVACRKM